jgi:dTDP-4-dehydrorhamnose reductase
MDKIMKKILLIGGTGGLGKQLTEHLESSYSCVSIGYKTLDVTNEEHVKSF